jgi:hypothetical protein
LPPILGESVFAIACLLSYDGVLDVEAPPNRESQNSHLRTMTVSDIHGGNSSSTVTRASVLNGPTTDRDYDRGNSYSNRSGSFASSGNRDPRGMEYAFQQNGLQQNLRQQYVPVRDGRVVVRDNRTGALLQETRSVYNNVTSRNVISSQDFSFKRPRGSGLG